MIYRVTLERNWDDITFDFDDSATAIIFADMATNAYSNSEKNEGHTFKATIEIIRNGGKAKNETSDSDSAETESTEESV